MLLRCVHAGGSSVLDVQYKKHWLYARMRMSSILSNCIRQFPLTCIHLFLIVNFASSDDETSTAAHLTALKIKPTQLYASSNRAVKFRFPIIQFRNPYVLRTARKEHKTIDALVTEERLAD